VTFEQRVLILAPFGRDGSLLANVLKQAGVPAEPCARLETLCREIERGAGAILVADEALPASAIEDLASAIKAQPAWSDLPVFVMTQSGQIDGRRRLMQLQPLGNETVISSFRMGLRARAHQYQLRDLFAEAQRAQETLHRANLELRRANEDLNQFAYSASHDLQEPLRMVSIYSQMLQRKYKAVLDSDANDYINYVVQGARRMEMLLKDLLDYTQVVDGVEEESEPVDSALVLQRAAENLSRAIEETGATLESHNLPVLKVKAVHLLQLLQNLIGNALKYRSEARPIIQVSAVRDHGLWKITVRDNGIGIDPQYARQVFGLFKRLHGGSSQYEGTGIGLAICQKIVERYGGSIWVESAGEGQGSSFCFTLPA
jgi:signal transduction histidine kinase